jgi:hypothetical protein
MKANEDDAANNSRSDVIQLLKDERAVGLRVAVVGFVVAGVGFLIAYCGFFWVGYFSMVLGWVLGAGGIVFNWFGWRKPS